METLEEKIARVVKEDVAVVPYDPRWPDMFEQERRHLLSCLPADLIGRIEHFGSTAVPGLAAKPIVDILVEVTSLDETRQRIVPILEARGYDYFWRPSWGDDTPPFYAWFIKRDGNGRRTHHLHMVEPHFEHWDRLLFRDYLIGHPDAAREYGELKMRLAGEYRNDRIAYTQAKSDFIGRIAAMAARYHGKTRPGHAPGTFTQLMPAAASDMHDGTMEYTIRNAEPADFASIVDLNSASVHYLSPLDIERLRHLHGQAAYHRVIEAGGRVAAFLLAFREGADYDSPNYDWFSRHYDSFLYIDRAAVLSSHRRKGYGAALYGDLILFASGSGIDVLTCEIDVSPPNPDSLRFHEGYGFREVGTQWLYGGRKQVSLREKRIVDAPARSRPGKDS